MKDKRAENVESTEKEAWKRGKKKGGKGNYLRLMFACDTCGEKWRIKEDAVRCCHPLWEKVVHRSQADFLGPISILTVFVFKGQR